MNSGIQSISVDDLLEENTTSFKKQPDLFTR